MFDTERDSLTLKYPLEGLRALDLTDEKGMLCGKILADLGVEVIKIEKPEGDEARKFPPFYHDEENLEKSLFYLAFNTGKKSITLNLEKEEGRELFKKLVKTADFLIESFDPFFLRKLGLGYDILSQIKPSLVMTSITPFGQEGPYADFKATDLTIQALGVLLSQQGDSDRAPVRTSFVPQAYMHASVDAAEATLIAHYYRVKTGKGQHIDISIMESVLWVAGRDLAFYNAYGTSYKREGPFWTRRGRGTVRSIWECKEGFVAFAIQGGETGAPTNRGIVEWMEEKGIEVPQFMKEKQWESWDFDSTNQEELDRICEVIGAFFKHLTADEIEEKAREKGFLINKVCSVADAFSHPQLEARNFWKRIHYDYLGDDIIYPGGFAKFSLSLIGPTSRAPKIGEHNEIIYGELGLSKEELILLKSKGVI
uniref:CoA transferase n=1 Tax=candidate division WOR-3 bacterium TaxID=2052148 RepID=A0A7C2K610_UNCW3